MGSARGAFAVTLAILSIFCLGGPLFLAQEKKDGKDKEKPKKPEVSGRVFDSDNRPLAGVAVTVWVMGKGDSVAKATTGKDGSYSITVEAESPFDVSFTKSKYRPCGVAYLAKQSPQQIGKVLYRRGEKMPVSAAHDHLQFVDRVAVLAASIAEKKERLAFKSALFGVDKDEDPLGFKDGIEFSDKSAATDLLFSRQGDLKQAISRLW